MGFRPQQSYFSLTLRVTVREMVAQKSSATLPLESICWISLVLIPSTLMRTFWSLYYVYYGIEVHYSLMFIDTAGNDSFLSGICWSEQLDQIFGFRGNTKSDKHVSKVRAIIYGLVCTWQLDNCFK